MAHCELYPKQNEDNMVSPEACNDIGETTASSLHTIKTLKLDPNGNDAVIEAVQLPDTKTLTRVGLKGFWKERKNSGQAFRYKVRDYFYEVKEAFKRAWIGYDACDIYDMGPIMCQKLRVQLVEFYKEHNEQVDEPKIDMVVLEILDLLKYEDIDVALFELYPDMKKSKVVFKGVEFETYDHTPAQFHAAEVLQQMKLEKAFTLFGRHILQLWI